jgi:hypothetical protein
MCKLIFKLFFLATLENRHLKLGKKMKQFFMKIGGELEPRPGS